MRVAAIELLVRLPAGVGRDMKSVAPAVRAALEHDPEDRNLLALKAIKAAADLEPRPDVILCPGWTFVGRPPPVSALTRAAGGATMIFEVLGAAGTGARPSRRKGASARRRTGKGRPQPTRTFVLRRGKIRELPSQVFAVSRELDCDVNGVVAASLSSALRVGRDVGIGLVLLCGEVNVLRIRRENGKRLYEWDAGVAAAGLRKRHFAGATIFNPAHTPSGSYVMDKRRNGPWAALISTSNRVDHRTTAHGVVRRKDKEPVAEVVLGDGTAWVALYETAREA